MSEIRSQATPTRDQEQELKRDLLNGDLLGNVIASDAARMARHAIQRGWSKPRTVNSAAELEALPVGSVIRSEDVTALKARNGAWLWDDGNYWEPLAGREVSVLFTPGDAG